jgi:hypothetical protein
MPRKNWNKIADEEFSKTYNAYHDDDWKSFHDEIMR